DLRDKLLQRGEELNFYPPFMQVRYENWVNGLNSDWLLSRQRFFGVAIPVWYRIDEQGEVNYDEVLLPNEDQLPIDPELDTPPGFDESQRGKPNGFIGEVDILDTWATSSLTPNIAGGWLHDEDLHERVYPMTVRPQGQDIIRTWLFSTVVRAEHEFDALPWKNAAISGWILDPDRKKMSKSKGNVVTPLAILERFGSDALRYWAASARLGADATYEEKQIKIGRRLAIKLLNASKFALTMGQGDIVVDPSAITEALDQAMLAALADVIDTATTAFEHYDYTRALEVTETFFWAFCDDYLELVKDRAYGRGNDTAALSARTALVIALDALLRLFAPVLPYATEEVWHWWREGSVHKAAWPQSDRVRAAAGDGNAEMLEIAGEVLAQLRKTKSEAKVSQRTTIAHATVQVPHATASLVEAALNDIRAAGRMRGELTITETDVDHASVSDHELDEPPAKAGR
ncbi:MAG: class I tRNA ligase family protein, partial [Bowdeniella nasicola]|nr:class I tRNA ligase family protein [Bowdeniella nasicola]